VKYVEKRTACKSCQPILHIVTESVRFLEAAIGSRDDGDFGGTRCTAPEDNLSCESGT
jgi:hypothetical protein